MASLLVFCAAVRYDRVPSRVNLRYRAVPTQEIWVEKKQKRQLRPRSRAGRSEPRLEQPLRERILTAALSAFMDRGYGGTSTLPIATPGNLSKREPFPP